MIDLGKWALDNKKLVYFLIVVLVLGGALSYYQMSKLEDPEIKIRQAVVVTVYPGASAHEVELEVTDMLEKNIRSMRNVELVESRSMNDVSIIQVGLLSTLPESEVEQHWDILRRKVNNCRQQLPKTARAPIVKDDFGDVFGLFYAVTSDGFSDEELAKYTELVQREIQNIEGISRVEIYGKRNKCLNIQLHEEKLANLGIHPAKVYLTLAGMNETIYSGYYPTGNQRLRISVSGKNKTKEDIENIILQGHENDQLRLKDLATITEEYEQPIRNEMFYDGEQAFGLSISVLSGKDITKLGDQVEKRLNELKKTQIPVGINFHKIFFQSERVKDTISSFLINLIESVAIVVLILMLTMGFRSGVIIGTSLVVIVFGTFLILNLLDGTLQRVSLGAFILAMGMLVDNAIVIVDGILVDLRQGVARKEALTRIGQKTAKPLLGATLIAILAFLPLYLSPDMTGVYVRDLFIVLAISLMLSLILALTHVPIMAERGIKVKDGDDNAVLYNSKFYKAYKKTLSWILHNRFITIILTIILLCVSAFCYQFVPQEFFPDMNYDQLYIEYKLPENSNSTQVKKDLKEIEQYLLAKKEITHVTTSIGATPSRYNLVRGIAMPSLGYGELIVDFTSNKTLVESVEDLQTYLTQHYPQAIVRVKRYNLMYKKYPIELQFTGPDPAVLKDLSKQAEEIMKNSPYIQLVSNDWENEILALHINYNQANARHSGISRSDMSLSLLASSDGIPISQFYEGKDKKNIYFKIVDNEGKKVNALENIPTFSMSPHISGLLSKENALKGISRKFDKTDALSKSLETTPLSQATDGVELVWEDPIVLRHNGSRAIKAQCEPKGVSAEVARQSILNEIEKIKLPTGYKCEWQGEAQASKSSTKYLFANLPLAIILIIFLLILLFKDYRKPIIILLSVPLILVGVVFGILLSGKTFGFVAIIGVLGLIGMMVKNGIILIDEITLQLQNTDNPEEALINSSMSRLRPVMMAALTTILGMIPLLSDDLFGSLAVTIMSGLLIGSVITLVFIPILYTIFFRIKLTKK